MNGRGKSDGLVVPKNPANKGRGAPQSAERGEGRGPAEGNPIRDARYRTLSRARLKDATDRIRQAAAKDKEMRFTTLWHHVYDVDRLREAYFKVERKSAPGVDGVTWQGYGRELEENLQDLSARLKRGGYRARPVRRVLIPKPDGRQRPIGVPTLEDKIVQRAACAVMGAVYEADFLGFSYGFRPKRSQHKALDAVSVGIKRRKVNWVLDADIRGFFDAIDHEWMVKFIEHRIADKRVVRHVKKWLHAGVLEDGEWAQVERGTPQGGSVSPMLANVYLHYVFDLWAHQWRERHACGDVIMVRYADDVVLGFQHRAEAERFREDLVERFRKFGLELNSDKTRLIEFGRYAGERRAKRGQGKPETFDFLGLRHICAQNHQGGFKLLRHTIPSRLKTRVREVYAELKRRMHHSIFSTGSWLRAVVTGYYRYQGVPDNWSAMRAFRNDVVRLWRRCLGRRSQKGRINWERMGRIAAKWIPNPRLYHPWPEERLRV
jgi:group II intron reverse transcriptase/maturase